MLTTSVFIITWTAAYSFASTQVIDRREATAVAPVLEALEPQGSQAPRDEWVLVWSDEFNRDGPPDPKNWIYEIGFIRHQELQWYQRENAWCEQGRLIIEARQEQKANPQFDPLSTHWTTNRQYASHTSASIRTQGLHSWQHGRFEMRARIDTRGGLWPTFWTMGVRGEWPHCGEVDIMEYYQGTLLFNVAWGTARRWIPYWDSVRLPLDKLPLGWSGEFHVWHMEWDHQWIRLYMDGRVMNETDLDQTLNEDEGGMNPFRQPHYILLNLAVGGAKGGDASATQFPARFEIDYVRVYQRRESSGDRPPSGQPAGPIEE